MARGRLTARIRRLAPVLGFALALVPVELRGQATDALSTPSLSTPAEREAFLARARVVRVRSAGKGVTDTQRATLADGVVTHDASIQSVDEARAVFEGRQGRELDFKDSWRFNVAAYRLDRLLELGMVPASVERKHRVGNLIIDRQWRVWLIDHSRAFRMNSEPRVPGNLTRIERGLLERLRRLDKPAVTDAVGPYLTTFEVNALLRRRDAIVALFDAKGPSAVFERRAAQ